MIWRFRRALKRIRFNAELQRAIRQARVGPCSKKEVTKTQLSVVQLQDRAGDWRHRAEWPQLIEEYYRHLFAATDLRELPDEVWEAHPTAQEVDPEEVREAAWQMKKNAASAPAEDGLTGVWLQGAPAWVYVLLAAARAARQRRRS